MAAAEVGGVDGNTLALLVGRAELIGTRCVGLLGRREVDGTGGNTVAALVVAGLRHSGSDAGGAAQSVND